MNEQLDSTFFVVRNTEMSGRAVQMDYRSAEETSPKWRAAFESSEFPITAVTAFPATSSYEDKTAPYAPFELWTASGDARVTVCWRGISTRQDRITGTMLDDQNKEFQAFNLSFSEAIVSDYRDLFVSHGYSGDAPTFMSTKRGLGYSRISCQVMLNLRQWHDFPRCRFSLELITKLASPLSMSGIWPRKGKSTSLPNDIPRGESEALIESKKTGPHTGSYLPCEIHSPSGSIERDCVIEFREFQNSKIADAVLHILSDKRRVYCLAGDVLRVPKMDKCDDMINLAEITCGGAGTVV